ncbi:MAG: tetratricopeptide repeat protein [Phycisphaerales bacterium]|nr:tetratricopeptide repeat protein [Phycisphaerales bacterium]
MRYWTWILPVAVVCAAGCSLTQHRDVAANAGQTDVSPQSGDAQPPSNFKVERMRRAMAGLSYDTGRVVIDHAVADAIAVPGTREQAMVEYERGQAELEQNHRTEAIGAFRTAILIAPDDPQMYEGLGLVLMSKGRLAEALAVYDTALDLDPSRVSAMVGIANVLQRSAEHDLAIEAWQAVLDAEPDHALAHGRLAVLLYYTGSYDEAMTHLDRAEALGYLAPAQLRSLIASGVGNITAD